MKPTDADEGTPVSVKIRERLQASRKRFHANDNIADFIQPGELEKLLDEVEHKMQGVLDSSVPVSVLFTAFAVCGASNAFNIIDGFNGLAGGVALIALAALALIAAQVGDQTVMLVCLAL
eukprot:gene23117-43557_t